MLAPVQLAATPKQRNPCSLSLSQLRIAQVSCSRSMGFLESG